VVEWTAEIGQAVNEGDVVALIETDKVTVDIKAEIGGVLTQQFSAM
jgi:2-oxoglutarate dehydrogenase E2 component (dihydrolipoamide succinyltransferase)